MKTHNSSQDQIRHKGVKGVAWLLGILGIFGVCLLFAWLVSKDNYPMASHGDRFALVQKYAPEKLDFSKYATSIRQQKVNPNALVAFVYYKKPGKVVIPDVSIETKAPKPSAAALASVPASASKGAAYEDRIEREAREVLHGDFGNNPERMKALGADYAAVQQRVNSILNK